MGLDRERDICDPLQYKHGTQHSLSDLEILKSHCHWLFHSFVFQCKIKTARFEWYIVDPNQALTWNPQLTKSLNDDHLLAPFCPRNPLARRQSKLQKKLSLVLHSRVFLKRLGVCTWHGTQMMEMMILIHPFFFPTWVGSFGMWILDGEFFLFKVFMWKWWFVHFFCPNWPGTVSRSGSHQRYTCDSVVV